MPQITSKTRSDFSLVAALSHGFYLAFFAAFLLLNPLIIVYAKEVALVVGNSSYSKEPIAGLSSHAQSLVADLNAQGFEVFPAIDAGHFEIKKAVEDFSFAAEEAEFAFVYLGGHSLKLKYSYFVPTDATLESRSDRPKLIKLKDIYKAAAGASNAALVFDFCHSHEFAAGWGESAGRAPVCSSKDLKLRPQKNTVSLLNRTTVIEASRWSNATINSLRDSMVEGAEPSTLLATLERKFVDSGATLLKRGEMDYKLGSLKEESSDLQYEQSVVSSIKQEFSPRTLLLEKWIVK